MPARHQFRRQAPAHEAGGAGNEDTCHSEVYTQTRAVWMTAGFPGVQSGVMGRDSGVASSVPKSAKHVAIIPNLQPTCKYRIVALDPTDQRRRREDSHRTDRDSKRGAAAGTARVSCAGGRLRRVESRSLQARAVPGARPRQGAPPGDGPRIPRTKHLRHRDERAGHGSSGRWGGVCPGVLPVIRLRLRRTHFST